MGCLYCCFIGGQGCKLMPWLYYGVLAGPFSTYAGFADFLTSIFIVPILLYWLTKEKKYIFCALWMILSTVLESVRTGMGGMLLVFAFAILLRDRWKAVPGLLLAGAMFVGTILFVPDVNKKFFGEEAGSVSVTDIVQGDAMSMDNIEMSGREYIWETSLDNCYRGNEVNGKGLGSAEFFTRHMKSDGAVTRLVVKMYKFALKKAKKVLTIEFFLLKSIYRVENTFVHHTKTE